ncbi:MAG: winged helix DNA-binding domain-containing protein [Thermoleophilia bacterium]
MAAEPIGARALNRATLARQMLLERADVPVREAVSRLVGLQAQEPLDPYVGLWSRLRGFRPASLAALLTGREAVRIVLMRGTIHLVTAEDCRELRPPVQPILDRELTVHQEFKAELATVDPGPVLEVARPFLAEPRTIPELRAELARHFPDRTPGALAYLCRNHLPLVQVPPRGVWGMARQVTLADAEVWLGRPLAARPDRERIALRYLAAFGPATPADLAAWSGLPSMRPVLEGLRPGLRAFRDERGRELLDVDDAPRPGPDVPAPPRFLPVYDNVLLSHADRSRFGGDDDRRRLAAAPGRVRGSVLLDGTVLGTWWTDGDAADGGVTLTVRHLRPVPARAARSLAAEGRRLMRMTHPGDGPREVRMVPLG